MSFGFGIGDFLKVVEFTFKTYEACCQSNAGFKDIARDIGNAHIILKTIHRFWETELRKGRELLLDEQEQLKHYSEECNSSLVQLDQILQRHSGLESSRKAKFRYVMEDLVHDFASIRDRLRQCTANLATFHTILTQDVILRRQRVGEEQMLQSSLNVAKILDYLVHNYVAFQTGEKEEPAFSQVSKEDAHDKTKVYETANTELEQGGIDQPAISKHQPIIIEWLDTVILADTDGKDIPDLLERLNTEDFKGLSILDTELTGDTLKDFDRTTITKIERKATRMTKSMARLLDSSAQISWTKSQLQILDGVFHALDWKGQGWLTRSDIQAECNLAAAEANVNISSVFISQTIDLELKDDVQNDQRITARMFRNILFNLKTSLVVGNAQIQEIQALSVYSTFLAINAYGYIDPKDKTAGALLLMQRLDQISNRLCERTYTLGLDLTMAGILTTERNVYASIYVSAYASASEYASQPNYMAFVEGMTTYQTVVSKLAAAVEGPLLLTLAKLDSYVDRYSQLAIQFSPGLQKCPIAKIAKVRREWWNQLIPMLGIFIKAKLSSDSSNILDVPYRNARINQMLDQSPRFDRVPEKLSRYEGWFAQYRLLLDRFSHLCSEEDAAFLDALRKTPPVRIVPNTNDHTRTMHRIKIKHLLIPKDKFCGVRIFLEDNEVSNQVIHDKVGLLEISGCELSMHQKSRIKFRFHRGRAMFSWKDVDIICQANEIISACSPVNRISKTQHSFIHVLKKDWLTICFECVDNMDLTPMPNATDVPAPIGYHSVSNHPIPEGWKCLRVAFADQRLSRRVCFLNTATGRPTTVRWRIQGPLDHLSDNDNEIHDTSQLMVVSNRTDYGFLSKEYQKQALNNCGKGDLTYSDLEYWI